VIVQEKYEPLVFLRPKRADELRVNKLMDNFEMDIKELALVTTRT
jgi:hypothetical protein